MQTSITEIIKRSKKAGSNYFSDDAMAFFQQTPADFKVKQVDGQTYVVSDTYGKFLSNRNMHKISIARVDKSGKLTPISDKVAQQIILDA